MTNAVCTCISEQEVRCQVSTGGRWPPRATARRHARGPAPDAQARTIQTPHPGCIAAVGGNGERRSGFALHSTRPASVIMVPTASLIEDARGFLSAYADYYAIAFDRSWQMPWLRQNGSQRIMCLT